MAEKEKKQEESSYGARLAAVMQSMKGRPAPTDFDEFETPLRKDIVDKLDQVLKKHGKS